MICSATRYHDDIQVQVMHMSGFMPGSVLTNVAPVTVEDHANARALGQHLGSCWCPRVSLPQGSCQSK